MAVTIDLGADDFEVCNVNADWILTAKQRAEEVAIIKSLPLSVKQKESLSIPLKSDGATLIEALTAYRDLTWHNLWESYFAERTLSPRENFERDWLAAVQYEWGRHESESSISTFEANATAVLTYGCTGGWEEGAAEVGIEWPGDATKGELDEFASMLDATLAFLPDYAQYIRDNRQELYMDVSAEKRDAEEARLWSAVWNRGQLWLNARDKFYSHAQIICGHDAKLQWQIGATEAHCTDCSAYNGRVYRASTWARYGIAPQAHELECGGYRCDCSLVSTDKPVTKGKPPAPHGQ